MQSQPCLTIMAIPTTCFRPRLNCAKCLVGKGQVYHRIHQRCLPTFPRFAPSPEHGIPLNCPHESIFDMLHRSIIVFQTCMLGYKGMGFVHPTPYPLQPFGGEDEVTACVLYTYYACCSTTPQPPRHRVEGRRLAFRT